MLTKKNDEEISPNDFEYWERDELTRLENCSKIIPTTQEMGKERCKQLQRHFAPASHIQDISKQIGKTDGHTY